LSERPNTLRTRRMQVMVSRPSAVAVRQTSTAVAPESRMRSYLRKSSIVPPGLRSPPGDQERHESPNEGATNYRASEYPPPPHFDALVNSRLSDFLVDDQPKPTNLDKSGRGRQLRGRTGYGQTSEGAQDDPYDIAA